MDKLWMPISNSCLKYLWNKLFWTGYGQTLDAYVECLSKLSLVGHRFDVLYIFDKNCWTCCWQNLYVDRPMTEIGQLLDRSWIFCQKIVQGLSDHTRGTCTEKCFFFRMSSIETSAWMLNQHLFDRRLNASEVFNSFLRDRQISRHTGMFHIHSVEHSSLQEVVWFYRAV